MNIYLESKQKSRKITDLKQASKYYKHRKMQNNNNILILLINFQTQLYNIVVLRLSPCSECSLYSSGNFPGVWSSKADVSGLNVGPIVLGDQEWSPRTMGPTLSPETSAFKLQTPGKFPEEYKLHTYM